MQPRAALRLEAALYIQKEGFGLFVREPEASPTCAAELLALCSQWIVLSPGSGP